LFRLRRSSSELDEDEEEEEDEDDDEEEDEEDEEDDDEEDEDDEETGFLRLFCGFLLGAGFFLGLRATRSTADSSTPSRPTRACSLAASTAKKSASRLTSPPASGATATGAAAGVSAMATGAPIATSATGAGAATSSPYTAMVETARKANKMEIFILKNFRKIFERVFYQRIKFKK